MNREKLFSAKIAGFSAGGITLTVGTMTFIDARLPGHIWFGDRQYPMGYWILLIGPVIFFGMYMLSMIPRTVGRKTTLSLSFFAAICAVSLFNFLPEFPHGNLGLWSLLFFIGDSISFWIHHLPLKSNYINESAILEQARIEMVKETLVFWRTLSLSLAVAFLAILIPWCVFIWDFPANVTTEPKEQLLLAYSAAIQMAFFSLYFIFCPLLEGIRKYQAAADMLLRMKKADMGEHQPNYSTAEPNKK
ncbi:MAG: hypothetical protein JW749_01040 [Sedimentisphaerales bacterium]|nr:hypothetical protein [Sedimentisphaerales bacterium]